MTSGHDARLVNQRQIAEIFGVTRETIRKWADQGMPVHKGPGRTNAYLPSEVIRWREERAERAAIESVAITDIEEAKRRKLAAEAALAELELAKARDEVVELELIGSEVGKAFAKCRARLLGVGASVVPELQLASSDVEMKAIVDDAVRQALEELSNGALELASGADESDQEDDLPADGGDAGAASGREAQ